jgi:hypothetical protein
MSTKLQKWRKEFKGSILLNDDPSQRGKFDHKCSINIGTYCLEIESASETGISGYYEFSFYSDDLSVNQAEAEANRIEKEIFEVFFNLTDLENIQFEIKWGELKAIGFPEGTKFTVLKTFGIDCITCGPSTPISKSQVTDFENLFQRLDNNQRKDFLLNLLHLSNISTKRASEDFFYKWMTFNAIFSDMAISNTGEAEDLKNFANTCPNISDLNKIIKRHDSTINKLSQESFTNRRGTENYSRKLRVAIVQSNDRDIWTYTILCIYIIRNDLFHEGKEFTDLKAVNKILKDIVRLGILHLLI